MLGADLETIGKAKVYQVGLKYVLGVSPDLDIQKDYVRVYYPPDKLPAARVAFARAMEAEPGAVRGDIRPVVQPYFLKKYAPALAGALVLGFIAGKAL